MIKINDLSFKYSKEDVVFENINLVIKDNDYILLHGENGSGKSTLVKCILGINSVKKGHITIDDKDINDIKDFTFIGYVEQLKNKKQDISITVKEYYSLICKDKNKIKEVLELMNINHLINKDISSMSGGQRQKVEIGKSLLFDVKYLIMDEPNTGLDFKSRKELYDLLNNLNKSGITVIIISHLVNEITCKINKIFEIKNSEVIENPKENCEYC